jgi:hypothetical protein
MTNTMIFDNKKLFIGSKFAIFNYAAKATEGYVDVDLFDYEKYNDKFVPYVTFHRT